MDFRCSFMSIFIVQAKHNSKIVKENQIKINLLTHFSTIDVLDCLLAEEEIHVITICQRSHKIGCCKVYIICTNDSHKLILNYTLNQNNVEPAFHKNQLPNCMGLCTNKVGGNKLLTIQMFRIELISA